MKKSILTILLTIGCLFCFTACHPTITTSIPKWDECSKSTNWHGSNANQRFMNMLSPGMSDTKFNDYLAFIKGRGCNCVHLILCNKGDGENANYCIYGNSVTWKINKSFTDVMTKRIKQFRKEGLGVVLWLTTDDSSAWNAELARNPQQYINDIDSLGWFKYASTVVVGLELDEYWSANQVSSFVKALRTKYKGKIGVHQTSGKTNYAGLADIMFYQTNPGKSTTQIASETKAALKCGKPVNFFEMERQENRTKCEAALNAGAYGVGNW